MSILSIRATKVACGTIAVLIGLAGPALAHVFAKPGSGAAGSVFTAGFTVGHGCDGSPTKALRVTIPNGVTAVKPQDKPGWTVVRTADTVEWRGGPLPANAHDSFTIVMTLPKAAGQTLYFPAVQECQQGERRWVDIPAAGQNRKDLHSPAPFVTVTP